MSRGWLCAWVCLAGCTDVFTLPISGSVDGFGVGDLGARGSFCEQLGCSPTPEVTSRVSATASGCHSYDTLTIEDTVVAGSYSACAMIITVTGVLSADGTGEGPGSGPGAGLCNGGGGHGGAGGDPLSCGGGKPYDAVDAPTLPGSGGGGAGGGAGGGVITLSAGLIQVVGRVSANGAGTSLDGTGGGAGGTVRLIGALLQFNGGVSVEAHGGASVHGGGGGGGRIVLQATDLPIGQPTVDVSGGSGTIAGQAGSSVIKQP